MYKHIFISSLAGLMLMASQTCITAQTRAADTPKEPGGGITVRQSTARQSTVTQAKRLGKGVFLELRGDGIRAHKHLNAAGLGQNMIDAQTHSASRAPLKASSTASLDESFEDYSGTNYFDWLPGGWTRQRTSDDTELKKAWYVSPADDEFPAPPDGDYYAGINYSGSQRDEWLITPSVSVKENQVFSFYAWFSPVYMFSLDEENINWDTYEFINKVKTASVQVMAQADGSDEWTLLKDIYDDYKDMTLMELIYAEMAEFTKISLPLTDYVGQNVRFAFRYYGADGDLWLLDKVTVDTPTVTADYSSPTSTQYWGFSCDPGLDYFSYSVAMYPVYSDLTWTNNSDDGTSTFTWEYSDPDTDERVTSADTNLTVAYKPDYSSEERTRYNFYEPPTLTVSAPGAADGTYTEPIDFIAAGGKPEYTEEDDDETVVYGLLPFNALTEGASIFTDTSSDGESEVPVFGYSDQTLNYWTNRTFQGDPEEDDRSEVMGYMNYIIPTDMPMVVTDVWTNVIGKISDDAELTASFYALNSQNEVPDEPFVSATCKGSDALVMEGYTNNYYALPFKFDSPVVLQYTDETPGYLIEISGFNQGGVEYFAPIQSYYPNKDSRNLGWLNLKIHYAGADVRSISRISNFSNENGSMFCSFAINLGAYYPWLRSETEAVTLDGTSPATVALDSYYDGADLSVTQADGTALPQWLKAEVSGRYGQTTLTLTANGTASAQNTSITLAAPGVSLPLTVNVKGNTISQIQPAGAARQTGTYSLGGQKLATESLPAGVYIERIADGTVRKVAR